MTALERNEATVSIAIDAAVIADHQVLGSVKTSRPGRRNDRDTLHAGVRHLGSERLYGASTLGI